jgi:hypothetical protein
MVVDDPRYGPGSDTDYTAVTLRIRITFRASNFLINRVNMDISRVILLHEFSISTYLYYLPLAQQPTVGPGLLVHEVSRSHTTTRHSR